MIVPLFHFEKAIADPDRRGNEKMLRLFHFAAVTMLRGKVNTPG
jgi:hypothetical protein